MQRTHCVSITKTNRLIMFREIMEFHSKKYMKQVKKFCGQNVELLKVKTSGTIHTVN
jgi:hypothetical protein